MQKFTGSVHNKFSHSSEAVLIIEWVIYQGYRILAKVELSKVTPWLRKGVVIKRDQRHTWYQTILIHLAWINPKGKISMCNYPQQQLEKPKHPTKCLQDGNIFRTQNS